MKKMVVVAAMALLVAGCVGCDSTSEQRIAAYKQALDQATQTSKELDLYIPQIDAAIASSEEAIKTGLPADQAENLLAKIDEAKKVKEKIIGYKAAATEAAAKAQAAIDTIVAGGQTDFSAEMQAIAAMLTSAGAVIPPPAGTYVTLGGTLLGIIAGLFGGIRSQKKYKTGMVDVVKSVDKVLDELDTETVTKARTVMADTQGTDTRNLVRQIKMPKAA